MTVFEAELKKGAFRMELPVQALAIFVRALANSALAAIEKKDNDRQAKALRTRCATKADE